MKLIRKLSLIAVLLIAVSHCHKVKHRDPVYEDPSIIQRNDSPLKSFNRRIELLNADNKLRRHIREFSEKKISLRSEIAREFTVKALNDWINHMNKQDINIVNHAEFMDDVQNLKGFSQRLQNFIIAKANSVMDNLALLDLKLKEQALIDQEVESINDHPGDMSSSLGDNLPWKERLEELMNHSASINSEFDVALGGICNVIRRINSYVNTMSRTYVDSKHIHKALPEEQYYPNGNQVSQLETSYQGLGPNAGNIEQIKNVHKTHHGHKA